MSDDNRLDRDNRPAPPTDAHFAHPGPIPGERDPGNLLPRQPGAMSGQFAGADIPAADHQDWMDETTARDRALEGGGSK